MANPEHVAILEQGVEAWNSWRVTDGNRDYTITGTNRVHEGG